MTKVEELRERLRYVTSSAWYGIIDETIAAAEAVGFEKGRAMGRTEEFEMVKDVEAFARGRAEGAEQMKAEIREAADEWAERYEYTPMRGTCIVPASVLAPAPKDADHATKEEIDEAIASEQKKYAVLDAKMAPKEKP